MKQYTPGYVTIPATKRDAVNKDLASRFGPEFFSGDGKVCSATVSLRTDDWVILSAVLGKHLSKTDKDEAITKCKKPTRAGLARKKEKKEAHASHSSVQNV